MVHKSQIVKPTLIRRARSMSHRLELGKFLDPRRLTQLVESRSLVIDEQTGATANCQSQGK
jgi:hypothetical protein